MEKVNNIPWATRLKTAEETGVFTEDDRSMAGDWTCCAVGEHKEQLACLGYDDDGLSPGAMKAAGISNAVAYQSGVAEAKDYFFSEDLSPEEEVIRLGYNFYYYVVANDVDMARVTYDAIQVAVDFACQPELV